MTCQRKSARKSDSYLKIVEWSDEDQCYIGTCPGLMSGGIHGDDQVAVYRELCQAVEEWISIYEADGDSLPAATAGKEYSGKFLLRVGKDLHKALAIEAIRRDESLNTFCVRLLREERARYGEKHAGRNNPADFSGAGRQGRNSAGRRGRAGGKSGQQHNGGKAADG